MKPHLYLALAAACALACAAQPAIAGKPVFTMLELQQLTPGQAPWITEISDTGLAIGSVPDTGFGLFDPAIWRDGVPGLLPTDSRIIKSFAFQLNNAGDAVGSAKDQWEGLPYQIGWKNGRLYRFNNTAFQPTDLTGDAFAGTYTGGLLGAGVSKPATWNGRSYTFLPTPEGHDGGVSMATESGWIAGFVTGKASAGSPAPSHAAVWKDGRYMRVDTPEGGRLIQLLDLTDQGDLLYSWADAAGQYRQSIWRDGASTEVLVPEGAKLFSVTDINGAGQMLAYRRLEVGPASILMYGEDGQFWDVDDSMLAPVHREAGWKITSFGDINEKGQVLAGAFNSVTNQSGQFILTPVPEAGTGALMAMGLTILALGRRGYRRAPTSC